MAKTGDSFSSNSDSNGDTGLDLPTGVLRSRGGWAGENLEIEHQRETLRLNSNDSATRAGKSRDQHAAVDLSQFRNEEVGKGYKAKHVVRQREHGSGFDSGRGVVDLSGGVFVKKEKRKETADTGNSLAENEAKKKPKTSNEEQKSFDPQLQKYLQCKGIRDFRRELDRMLSKKGN